MWRVPLCQSVTLFWNMFLYPSSRKHYYNWAKWYNSPLRLALAARLIICNLGSRAPTYCNETCRQAAVLPASLEAISQVYLKIRRALHGHRVTKHLRMCLITSNKGTPCIAGLLKIVEKNCRLFPLHPFHLRSAHVPGKCPFLGLSVNLHVSCWVATIFIFQTSHPIRGGERRLVPCCS